jgi:hypothetical protein
MTANEAIPYDMDVPLEDQLCNSSQIVIDYEPFDPSVSKFLNELERFSKTGIDQKVNIKVIHNDNIAGLKLKKKAKKAENDIKVNELIKLMALSHIEADCKLEELSNLCTNRECNAKE